ncbi:MAG: hypothetical protein IPG00_09640 [Saprospiraceae bacterium]|nr:hypothetical protein [Saprospiraceae bacterium]
MKRRVPVWNNLSKVDFVNASGVALGKHEDIRFTTNRTAQRTWWRLSKPMFVIGIIPSVHYRGLGEIDEPI